MKAVLLNVTELMQVKKQFFMKTCFCLHICIDSELLHNCSTYFVLCLFLTARSYVVYTYVLCMYLLHFQERNFVVHHKSQFQFKIFTRLQFQNIIGGVYKPRGRGHTRGREVAQMTTTLDNSYFVKMSTQGEGGQNCPKFCPRGLYTPPYYV